MWSILYPVGQTFITFLSKKGGRLYYLKTGITEFGITGVGTRDAGTSEFSNLKTGKLEFGITGGFPNDVISQEAKVLLKIICSTATYISKSDEYASEA
jgi:hypothetical protein